MPRPRILALVRSVGELSSSCHPLLDHPVDPFPHAILHGGYMEQSFDAGSLSDRYCLKAREVYLPPLSDQSVFTLCPDRFPTLTNHGEIP